MPRSGSLGGLLLLPVRQSRVMDQRFQSSHSFHVPVAASADWAVTPVIPMPRTRLAAVAIRAFLKLLREISPFGASSVPATEAAWCWSGTALR
jgi:hypothetical protein